ncbi:MAG: SoxR reducing system RseC family protein [Thioalkalivibrionaceae bacterium]
MHQGEESLVWARVIAVDTVGIETVLWVEPERRGACDGCSAQPACGVGLLDRWFSRHPRRFRALDARKIARVGDRVALSVAGEALVSAALLTYLLPLVALILAAIVGSQVLGPWLAGVTGVSMSASHEIAGVVFAFLGFFGALILGRWIGRGRLAGALPVVVARRENRAGL